MQLVTLANMSSNVEIILLCNFTSLLWTPKQNEHNDILLIFTIVL